MMAEHTPGPWIWQGELNDLVSESLYERWRASGYKDELYPIVVSGGWRNDSQVDVVCNNPADALLIAAAPDLLHALKALIDTGAVTIDVPELDAARAAIAKAEGR